MIKNNDNVINKRPMLVLCIILLGVSIISYFDFLSGLRIYDLVADVHNNFIPEQYGLIDLFKESVVPMWSFYKGLGQQVFVGGPNWLGDIFAIIEMIFGKEMLPYLYGVTAVIKIFLSGIFFYEFLKEAEVSPFTRVLFAFLYAFNGHMICRGLWIHYATEVVFVALWLWSLERYHKNKKGLFPIALALLFISRVSSYVYIYSGLSFLYIILIYFFDNGLDVKGMCLYVIKFIPFYLIGLGISAIFFIPGIFYLVGGPRVGGSKLFFSNPFKINSILDIITVFLKSFSYSIMGTSSTTGSSKVILEDPILYCGIFTMFIFTQIFGFKNSKKREKNVIFTLLILICIYYIFPYARYFLNAFSIGYYKTSSFWTIIFLIISGVYVTDKIEKGEEVFNKNIFLHTLAAYSIIFALIFILKNDLIYIKSFVFAIIIMALFFVILIKVNKKSYKTFLILSLTVFEFLFGLEMEISGLSRVVNVNNNNKSQILYDNELQETVNIIKENDNNNFYRIIVDSKSLNNSQRYNYMGTESYVSVPSGAINDFYNMFDLYNGIDTIQREFNNRYILNTMLGVKYFIKTSKESEVPKGFEHIFDCKNYEVYENTNVLPLAYVYNQYAYKDDINNDINEAKDFTAINAVILNDEDVAKILDKGMDISKYNVGNFNETINDFKYEQYYNMEYVVNDLPKEFSYVSLNNDPQILISLDNVKSNQYYEITMTIDSSVETGGQIYYCAPDENFSGEKVKVFEIKSGTNAYAVNFLSEDIVNNIRIDVGDTIGNFTIKDIKIVSRPMISDKIYTEALNALDTEAFEMQYFSQNKIRGSVNMQKDGVLFFSIPHDKGWKVKINGDDYTDNVITANGGFIAVPLNGGGVYEIELSYLISFFVPGCLISICSLFVYFYIFVIRNKKSKIL